jgi:hypothetical protein
MIPESRSGREKSGVILRSELLAADFFTAAYRISGHVAIGKRRLADMLSDRLSDFLSLQDIYVSRIHKPGEITAHYRTGSLIKSQINFVVLPTKADGLSKDHVYAALSRQIQPVFVTVPYFELQGVLNVVGKPDMQTLLATGIDQFVPLLNATATTAAPSQVQFSGPVILVNKSSIEIFCLADEG